MKREHITGLPLDELTLFRQEIHQHPEISGKEDLTAKKIAAFLRKQKPDILVEQLGGTGVAAVFGSGEPSVLIRCELDALPIQEINTFPWRSSVNGVSHKCGHDGHATILAGLATVLKNKRPGRGRAILLFQPAEENGEGAARVLADEKFKQLRPGYVFALHNLPGYPLKSIVVKEGAFTAAVNSVIIRLKGKTAHAGEPEKGINPALAIAEILSQTDKWNHNIPADPEFTVITPIYVTMGEPAYGTSAGYGEVHLTIRCHTNERKLALQHKTEVLAQKVASGHKLEVEIKWLQEFFANNNAAAATSLVRESAEALGLKVIEREMPFSWGEDFGLFTQKFPGAMFGLGAGENTPALHNPDYDFPDALLPAGITMFYSVISRILDNDHHIVY